MPAVFLDRLPLPSLQAYTAVSVALLSCSIYYALQVTSSSEWRHNATLATNQAALDALRKDQETLGNFTGSSSASVDSLILDYPLVVRFFEVFNYMIQEPLCIWTMINMAYCCLILIGKVIQKLVFGELRVSEQQHIKDKFWNFVFYKFIFIFGVMNVQFMDEVVLWCSWFSVLGFLHLLAQLSKDRFEYLSFSPTTPKWTHVRLLMLLTGIMFVSTSLFGICIIVGLHAGLNTFAFMAAECSLVTFRTLYVIARYAIHLWDTHHVGVWERRATYIYYTELFFELIALATDFLHHLHMLLWGNIFLSMASLVICMQLRYLFYEIQRRAKKHKNYLRVIRHMETNYKMATGEELETNSDDCAICWDSMDSARKLPCGHLFHNSCLRSWLEQDTSCPTCRMTLTNGARGLIGNNANRNMVEGGDQNVADRRDPTLLMMPTGFLAALGATGGGQDVGRLPNHQTNQTTNHFFHFDGSRYVSWFPSFSVEVTHTNLLGERPVPVQSSQLDTMARQVLQMFPHMPMNTIIEDLRVTRSVELTVENILEERLLPPASAMFHGTHTGSQSPAAQVPQDTGSQQILASNVRDLGQNSENGTELETAEVGAIEDLPKEFQESSKPQTLFSARDKHVLESYRQEKAQSKQMAEASLPSQKAVPALTIPTLGFRFSKCPQEREQMLAGRKDELLRAARRRYLHKGDDGDSTQSNQEF